MKRRIPIILICLLCGALCVAAAHWASLSLRRPDVFLRLVPVESRGGTKVVLRFTNIGNHDVTLNVGGMEYFVFAPSDDSHTYMIHAYDGKRGYGTAVLEPGKSLDVGDVYPFMRTFPAGKGTLKAVYSVPDAGSAPSPAWTGVVHSPYIPLEVAGK